LAFETQVSSLKKLKIWIDDEEQPEVLEAKPGVCKEWFKKDPQTGDIPRCAVLELENWPDVELPEECKKEPPPHSPCRVDEHFAALYDLVVEPPPPGARLLPFVADKYLVCDPDSDPGGGPGQPPGGRCPPAMGTKQKGTMP
jgi:hypothetical protein